VLKKHFEKANTHGCEMFEARMLNARANIESIGNRCRISKYIREVFTNAPRGKLMAALANPYTAQTPCKEDPRSKEFRKKMTPTTFQEKYNVKMLDPTLKFATKEEIWSAISRKAASCLANNEEQDAVGLYEEVARDFGDVPVTSSRWGPCEAGDDALRSPACRHKRYSAATEGRRSAPEAARDTLQDAKASCPRSLTRNEASSREPFRPSNSRSGGP
jgi:hypothetical protein